MNLEITKTNRGFEIGKFVDAKGVVCSIQESSLATESAIWFGVNEANPQRLDGDVMVDVKPPVDPIPISGWPGLTHDILYNTRMHLTIRNVKTLIRNFEKFLKTKTVQKRIFYDRYGIECSIQLTNDCIELGCDNADPRICDNGWRPVVFPEGTVFNTHMFLSSFEVESLLPSMRHFVENGTLT